jgi:type II secretory pathway component GspD/PulD (secretin)
MSNVKRLSVGILMIAVLLAVGAQGQPAQPKPAQPKEDEPVLKLSSNMEEVPIAELVQLYAEYTKQPVMYDPKMLHGTVNFAAPKDGVSPDIEETLLTALSKFRLTLVKAGDYCEIVPTTEACTMCDTVAAADLVDLAPHRFARVVVHLQHTDPNVARGALQNLCTRSGGMVNPIISHPNSGRVNALILCDTAENLRQMLKAIAEIDTAPGKASLVVSLKNAKIADIFAAVASSAGKEVEIGVVEESGQLVLTGRATDIDRVAGVIAALDVKSGG